MKDRSKNLNFKWRQRVATWIQKKFGDEIAKWCDKNLW